MEDLKKTSTMEPSMRRNKRTQNTLALCLSLALLVQTPPSYGQSPAPVTFPIDNLIPAPGSNSDTGVMPKMPTIGDKNQPGPNQPNGDKKPGDNKPGGNQSSNNRPKMNAAKVPEEFSCDIFDNGENTDIFLAIESLSKEVSSSAACGDTPTAKSIADSGDKIKASVSTLLEMMNGKGPAVDQGAIEQSISTAINSLGDIGDMINNNEFLNSACGRQTMSTGKLLLAVNDVISGLGPYALFAISMNAALVPALPFVMGAVVGTTAISAINQMIKDNQLDMANPNIRKAVVQNTCQFIKVSKKVEFLQLAQSGKINQINEELKRNIDYYSTLTSTYPMSIATPVAERNRYIQALNRIEEQYRADSKQLASIEQQNKENNDDFLLCVTANELTRWGYDGTSFPISVVNSLNALSRDAEKTSQLQIVALTQQYRASVKKINTYATDAAEDLRSLRLCVDASRAWLNSLNQGLKLIYDTSQFLRSQVENEMSKNPDYITFATQEEKLRQEKVLVSRVQRAMEELSRDNSIIDRSEMAQRLVNLKAGLFQRQSWLTKSAVEQWIDHTKSMYDQAIAAVRLEMEVLRAASYSITDAGRIYDAYRKGRPIPRNLTHPSVVGRDSADVVKNLSNLTLSNLRLGTREHELTCQQLQATWLDWASATEHLGAIQLFCDMIDSTLDSRVDSSITLKCRGDVKLSGVVMKPSLIQEAKATEIRLGYRRDIKLVKQRMDDLQCPVPPLSVMKE